MNPKSKALAKAPQAMTVFDNYTPEQLNLIRKKIAPNCPDEDLKFFLTICQLHKLDPFLRDAHYVPRNVKNKAGGYEVRWTVQIGIDGYRKVAARTGHYAGSDDAVFDGAEKPRKATVTVWRMVSGTRCPFTATAFWSEYYPSQANARFQWDSRPRGMLAKCAEALALRKGFPEDLSGMYVEEELHRNPEDEQPEIIVAPVKDDKPAIPKDQILKMIDEAKTLEELEKMKPEISRSVNSYDSSAEKDEVIMHGKKRKDELQKKIDGAQETVTDPTKEKTLTNDDVEKLAKSMELHTDVAKLEDAWKAIQSAGLTFDQFAFMNDTYEAQKKKLAPDVVTEMFEDVMPDVKIVDSTPKKKKSNKVKDLFAK